MILSDISIKRPVFATVMSVLLVAFGVLSFLKLPVRELPEIEFPIVTVITTYPGASAQVVENRVTQIIENSISGIEAIKSITSASTNGASAVSIEFKQDHELEIGVNDVRDRISSILRLLPEEVDPPQVLKVNTDDRAIIWFGITSTVLDPLELTDYIERNIEERLSVVDGVARLRFGSRKRPSIRIWLDRQAMAARNLTVPDIEAALRAENIELPAGRLESGSRDFTLRVERIYQVPEDFAKLVLAEGEDGHLIRLGEVARIEVGPENYRTEYRRNGITSQSLGVVKQSKANILDVAEAVKKEAKLISEQLPPHMKMVVSWDSSLFVAKAIDEVYRTLFISMTLVIFVIYLFLGSFRAAFIPAITVPVSIIATFWVLSLAGYSINMLTLLALVLTIGLVVDDSIVVLENCYRRVEKGEPALLAAFRGSRQVAFAVIATTLVLISVFLPVFFQEGTIVRLFKELALTVTAAVGFSSFVALTLSAMLCSKILTRKEKKGWLRLHLDRWFKAINQSYDKLLRLCFGNKWAIFTMLAGSVLIIFGLGGAVNKEFVPEEDRGGFFMIIRGPEGTGFDTMRSQVLEIEQRLMPAYEAGEVQTILINIPGFRTVSESVNSAWGIVILPHWDERTKDTRELIDWSREQLSDITDVFPFIREFSAFAGGGAGGQVQFVIGGNTYQELAGIRDRMLDRIAEYPGLVNVDTDYQETQPQMRIDVDRDRAADIGVSVAAIGRTLETMLAGRRITTYVDRGEEYNVMLQAEKESRIGENDIDNIFVRSERTGELVPLSNLVTIRNIADAGILNRYNRVRSLTISASVAPGYDLNSIDEFLKKTALEAAPEAVGFDTKGELKEFEDANTVFIFSFGMALLIVYLVLAAQFESFIHPVTILLTVPLAIAGGLFGLYLTGLSLNIYSAVGLVILIGIAAKNGILIVEFANQLRDQGMDVETSIVEAAKIRLRPVVMTGISTAMGSLPLVLASGPGSASRQSIGIIIMFGVVIATFFTLIVIPLFFNLLGKYTGSPGFVERKLQLQEKEITGETPAPAE